MPEFFSDMCDTCAEVPHRGLPATRKNCPEPEFFAVKSFTSIILGCGVCFLEPLYGGAASAVEWPPEASTVEQHPEVCTAVTVKDGAYHVIKPQTCRHRIVRCRILRVRLYLEKVGSVGGRVWRFPTGDGLAGLLCWLFYLDKGGVPKEIVAAFLVGLWFF